MKFKFTRQRKIAIALLGIWSINLFAPTVCYALTSGPAQPETKGFQPASVSDMVDLQTGDFKYNIPLLDIDGYPINLNYASGVNMDDEASWVGLGWSLTPGAINRQVRGVPDDMAGDGITTEHYTKPKVTVGGRLRVKIELGGHNTAAGSDASSPPAIPSPSSPSPVKLQGTFTFGIFSDNYTGMGAEIGVNPGITIGNDGFLTASLGLGIMSSTASGVDISPSVNLSLKLFSDQNMTVNAGQSASLGYNTRSGMKDFTLGSSFGVSGAKRDELHLNFEDPTAVMGISASIDKGGSGSANYSVSGSTVSYNTEPVSPKITIPYNTTYGSFSFDGGGAATILFTGGGGTGYRSVKSVQDRSHTNPEFGFLYAEKGRNQKDAVMDFIREKDNPVIPDLPNLALPVHTPDLFTYTSQTGGGQFKLYRGGSGTFFDNEVTDQSTTNTLGIDVGIGSYFHGGITWFQQNGSNTTRKWTGSNNYLQYGDFQDPDYTNEKYQHVYFKQIGEKTSEDANMLAQLGGTQAQAVSISGTSASAPGWTSGSIKKQSRDMQRTTISYLTAAEAAQGAALDQQILTYTESKLAPDGTFTPTANEQPTTFTPRISDYRKGHHLSEISVTDDQGKRMVYGIPVYNISQDEYSFAISDPAAKSSPAGYSITNNNQIGTSFLNQTNLGAGKGIDNYYHRESQPAYASSFLLTAILSPDYVDKTGNGVTPDDLGTAIQFHYSKAGNFNWRTPYQDATINKCLLADKDDDKASIVYGTKELYYVHSIESKTKIAYFIIADDRCDGLGVTGLFGGKDVTNRQKYLKEIRLYSKADLSKPIKIVKFDYDYSLCPGVPNFYDPTGTYSPGKLTLKKVWFEYGKTTKGHDHPYVFTYDQGRNPTDFLNKSAVDPVSHNIGYNYLSTDRWGVYKPNNTSLPNDEFPYTTQGDTVQAATNASMWHLRQINLPTGGVIGISYESDDYAYVQDKKATVMIPAVITYGSSANKGLIDMTGFNVPVASGSPTGTQTTWFEENYLNGSKYIYSKMSIKMSTNNSASGGADYDYIPCFSEIDHVTINGTMANVVLKSQLMPTRWGASVPAPPISLAAWQHMKEDYPRYAYPGFDTRATDDNAGQSFENAVRAICSAFGNLDELTQNFYQKAYSADQGTNTHNWYGNRIDAAKCIVRVVKDDGRKLGGGVRVNKVMISDEWSSPGTPHLYGQAYNYTTVEDGKQISSGVASYEPSVGNDENALKEPVNYEQNVSGGISNYYDIETPFGESFYPAPSVVYSKVTVTDLDQTGVSDANRKTGYVVNEFYTAKDFPVRVSVTDMQTQESRPHNGYFTLDTWSVDNLCMSQGYAIELNDMHGKPKGVRVYNQSGAEISSTEYYYNASQVGAGMRLNNSVSIVSPDGTIKPGTIGRDVEFYTDFREQETLNDGQTINLGADIVPLFGIPLPIPHWPSGDNNEDKLFRSACGVKVSQYYGVIDKVVKMQNGSTVTTQNIAYDGNTGDPVVTKTQNEFNKDIYSVNIPAYWAYNGMGGGYQNLGTVLTGLKTTGTGEISSAPNYSSFFTPGDEFIDLSAPTDDNHFWVIDELINNTTNAPDYSLGMGGHDVAGYTRHRFVMDRWGKIITSKSFGLVKIIRSGYRNMLGAGLTNLVCLNNPIVTDATGGITHLQIANTLANASATSDLTALKVINASASTYDENWSVEQPDYHLIKDPTLSWQLAQSIDEVPCSGADYYPGGVGTDLLFNFRYYSFYSVDYPDGFGMIYNPAYDTPLTFDDYGNSFINPNYGNILTYYHNDIYTMYDNVGGAIYTDPSSSYTAAYVSNILNDCGVQPSTLASNEPHMASDPLVLHMFTNFNVPVSGDYYMGYGAVNGMDIIIDGCGTTLGMAIPQIHPLGYGDWNWFFSGPITLTKGQHTIEFAVTTQVPLSNTFNLFDQAPLFGAEIYALSGGSPPASGDVIFNTHSLVNDPNLKMYTTRTYSSGALQYYTYSDLAKTKALPCIAPPTTINPFIYGFKGNWRPYQTKVFQQNRAYNNLTASGSTVDVKNAGFINNFYTDWFSPGAGALWTESNTGGATNWTIANTVTVYDKYGQQMENKDALGRYSAALFGFNGELPVAVASNAMNREIYTGSFEDGGFAPGASIYADVSPWREFAPLSYSNYSHTGSKGINISSNGVTMSTQVYNNVQKTLPYLAFDANKQFVKDKTTLGLYPNGFEPVPGKAYIFNAWVKDGNPTVKSVDNTLAISTTQMVSGAGNTPSNITLKCKAIVEGWKMIEGTIDLSSYADGDGLNISISPQNGATVYIDDIRIHPKDSHMKTYAYDARTMRLMAEMDENNFATFYEYDSEGLLIRVKKETEKGIMTLKESRSSYIKQP